MKTVMLAAVTTLALVILGPRITGLSIVGCVAAAVLIVQAVNAVRRTRRRRGREAVWRRREGPYIAAFDPDDPPTWPQWEITGPGEYRNG